MSFFPARIIEIWSPLLNAWLNSNRVWNSDTNGNHDKTAVGMKIINPITYSYALESSLTEAHSFAHFKSPLHVCAILIAKEKEKNVIASGIKTIFKTQLFFAETKTKRSKFIYRTIATRKNEQTWSLDMMQKKLAYQNNGPSRGHEGKNGSKQIWYRKRTHNK